MGYWKIVAGHAQRTPDEVKSVMLGDWLRKEYIAIGVKKDTPQYRVFKDGMKIGDKVMVVTDGFIWALGEITGELERVQLPNESNLYEYRRTVVWYRITKRSYKQLPTTLRNKLQANRTINELDSNQWESLLLAVL